jgi:hypothetical protein
MARNERYELLSVQRVHVMLDEVDERLLAAVA